MVDSSMRMKGYAFITSSSHDEASQESDRIKGSFFTYYFLSGLRGAADLSQDGRVTLNEVYQYAFHETLSRTEKTVSGAQHPGYEIQMSGSGDVVLTDLRKTSVLLIFDKDLSGRISIRNSGGVFVAEVAKVPGKEVQLSLEADRYEVLLEKEQKVYGTTLTLSRGREVFDVSKMEPVKISKNAGKGDEYVLVPWSFALLPSVSTGYVEGKKVIHNYSFNLVADYSDRFSGFAMGTVNFVGEDADGFLFGFGGNYIKGPSSGFQLAGTLNYVGGEFSGFQLSGMLNYVKKDMDGFQLGPLNVGGRSRGSQIGVVNVSEDFQGFQTGLVNVAEDVDGAQVGLVNVADKVSGVQIGLVNIADENEVPIGLVNIIKNGRFNLAFWYDSAGFWNLGLKMGGKYFYSLLVLGTSLDTERQLDAVGLGGYIPLYGNLYLELDALYQTYYPLGKYSKELELDLEGDVDIFTARLSLGFEVLKGIKIFGGLSMPLVYTNHEGRNGIIPRVKSGGLGDVMQMSEWFFGIEIF